MRKLEDIPKKQIFEVPEGYFEKLPGIIQSRVTPQQEVKSLWSAYSLTLRYALPVIVILVVGIFWFTRPQTEINAENMLASIQTEDLVAYLDEADLTTEELLEDVSLNSEDANQIEGAVYEFQLNDSDFKEIFDDIEQ
jgi:hypothetical protein